MNAVEDAANKLLAKERLGVNFTVNIPALTIYLLKQELSNKRIFHCSGI